MTVGDDILAWSVKNLGKKIGDGECWTHVETALKESGGKTSSDIMGAGKVTADADYIWGTQIEDLRGGVAVGDILQFRDFVWEDVTETKTTHPDGSWETGGTWREERPHHTAIVEKALGQGAVEVIEQNVPAGGSLKRTKLRLTSFRGPTVTEKKPNGDVVVTTPIHRVSGKVRAYRPQAAAKTK